MKNVNIYLSTFKNEISNKFLCSDCINELKQKDNRRFYYPFIGCNNCGVYFSVISEGKYINNKIEINRSKSSFKDFNLCNNCLDEFNNPNGNRYNYPFISCPNCGPKLYSIENNELIYYQDYREPFEIISSYLKDEKLVLIKTGSMFLLLADAKSDIAVNKLRKVKNTLKPLPVLFKDIDTLSKYVYINENISKVLNSRIYDILILKKNENNGLLNNDLSKEISKSKYLGVSLPFDPFLFILQEIYNSPIVFTSANLASDGLIIEDEKIKEIFLNKVDFCLLHNLEFKNEVDFSIGFYEVENFIMLRRAGSYVGNYINIPYKAFKGICVGPELESSIALAVDNKVFISTRMGYLVNKSVFDTFEKNFYKLLNLFNIDLDYIVADLHPYYLSTTFAKEFSEKNSVPIKYVQHHKAHIYSLILDRNIKEDIIGFSFDGTGYGEDGKIWGGEVFIGNIHNLKRVAHFKYIPIIAGNNAIENPVYVALSFLSKYLPEYINLFDFVNDFQKELIYKMINSDFNVFYTSSVGRLFDIAAVLNKLKNIKNIGDTKIAFSGQLAIELEVLASSSLEKSYYPFKIDTIEDVFIVDTLDTFKAILNEKNSDINTIAKKFHNTISKIILNLASILREKYSINSVGFSGGVFQNRILLNNIYYSLIEEGFKVYLHNSVAPNDSGISLGQVAALIYN
jgi:hydrogenase maturation protein HypF